MMIQKAPKFSEKKWEEKSEERRRFLLKLPREIFVYICNYLYILV